MSRQKTIKIDDLTVKVTYTVSMSDLDMPEDVYKEIENAFDNGVDVVLNSMEHTEAQEWLSTNCKESDSDSWEVEIFDIVAPDIE